MTPLCGVDYKLVCFLPEIDVFSIIILSHQSLSLAVMLLILWHLHSTALWKQLPLVYSVKIRTRRVVFGHVTYLLFIYII